MKQSITGNKELILMLPLHTSLSK